MRITPDALISLGRTLRDAGFKIGPAHHIDALRLLDALEHSGAKTDDRERLVAYFAPIYCANAEQQAQFPDLMKAALRDDEPAPTPPQPRQHFATLRSKTSRRVLAALIGFGAIALAALSIYRYAPHEIKGRVIEAGQPLDSSVVALEKDQQQQLTNQQGRFIVSLSRADLPAEVTANKPGYTPRTIRIDSVVGKQDYEIELTKVPPQPPVPPPPEFTRVYATDPHPTSLDTYKQKPQDRFEPQRLLLIGAPASLALVWWIYWIVRRRAWLARLPNQMPKSMRQLSSGARRSLSLALDTGRAGHELRRRTWVVSPELNVEATLSTILEGAGTPRLIFGSRLEPEYIALIDETSQVDHLARLGDELMMSLEGRDVSIKRYFFRDSPLSCDGPATERKPRGPGLPVLTLEELLGRHPHHRWIIVTDGRPCFDGITGQVQPWVYQVLQSFNAVLLSPTPIERWGRREWALSRIGFTVLPLSPQGLTVLGELHGSEKPVEQPPSSARRIGPPRWIHEPLSMLLPTPPSGITPKNLCEELRAHLGNAAYLWFQATAVYPEIHWGMTLRVGASLLSDRELAEALPRLVRLPWFRESYMPSWLRVELATTLSDAEWKSVHGALTKILEAAKTDASGDIELRIAAPAQRPWWQRLASALRPAPKTRRGKLHRDPVFLRFMQGPNKLAVRAVERIKRLFFREGLWSLGVRGGPLLVVTVIACGLLWARWPVWFTEMTIVRDDAPKPPSITAVAMTGDSQAPVLVGYENGEVFRVHTTPSVRISAASNDGVDRFAYADERRFVMHLASGQAYDFSADEQVAGGWRNSEMRRPWAQSQIVVGPRSGQLAHYTADGTRVAFAGKGEMREQATGGTGPILCAAFMPDSGELVAVFKDRVQVLDGKAQRSGPKIDASHCIAHPDGKYIFGWNNTQSSAPSIWRLSLSTGKLESPITLPAGAPVTAAAASRDGRALALLRGSQLEVYDGISGEARGKVTALMRHFAISADGESLAMAKADGYVEVWRLTKPREVVEKVGKRVVLAIAADYSSSRRLAGIPGSYSTAQTLLDVLTSRFGYESILLKDASKQELRAQIDKLTQMLSAEDDLVVYFGGRGSADRDGTLHLVLSDDRNDDVSAAEAALWLRRLAPRRVLVILDTSHARLARQGQRPLEQEDARTRLLLSSADEHELAYTRQLERVNSEFMKALTDTLSSTNASLSAAVLSQTVRKAMAVATVKQTPNLDPIPAAGHTGGEFVFVPVATKGTGRFEVRDARVYAPDGSAVNWVAAANNGKRLPRIEAIVLHATGQDSLDASLKRLTEPQSRDAAHILIGRDGKVVQLARLDRAVGVQVLESYDELGTINIQFVNGKSGVYGAGLEPAYAPAQLKVGREVVQALLRTYPEIRQILGHDDVPLAPGLDPGPEFPKAEFQALLPLKPAWSYQVKPIRSIDSFNIVTIALSSDGQRIVSGSQDGSVRMWEVESGKQIWGVTDGHAKGVLSVAFSPNGRIVASAGADNAIRKWDAENGRPLGEPITGHSGAVNSIAFSPDGTRLASGSADAHVMLWEVPTHRQIGKPLTGHDGAVRSVAFSPDGRLLVSGGADYTLRVWNTETAYPAGPELKGHTAAVNSVAFSPDGRQIVSGSDDQTIRLWDWGGTRQTIWTYTHRDYIRGLAFNSDGTLIASGSTGICKDGGCLVPLLDVRTGKPAAPGIKGHWNHPNSVAFSRDNTLLVSGGLDAIRLWMLEEVRTPSDAPGNDTPQQAKQRASPISAPVGEPPRGAK